MEKTLKTLIVTGVLLAMLAANCLNALNQNKLCSKILFTNIDEYDMPWIQVEEIYQLFSSSDGFPVYSNNINGLFMYYDHDTSRGIKQLVLGKKIGDVFGLVGLLPGDFEPETWLNSGNFNKNDIFGEIVTSWKYYSPLEKSFRDVSHKPKAVCAEDDFVRCSSGNVFVNDILTGQGSVVLNDPRRDFFGRLQGVYSEIRPVFKHSRQNWYLYFRKGFWRIGTSYKAATTNDILRVKGFAFVPEFVTSRWQKWTGTDWIDLDSKLRLMCRGISNGVNKCGEFLCKNSATCVYTKANETLCVCTSSTYGSYCTGTERCPYPGVTSSAVGVIWTRNLPGDVATLFCKSGYRNHPVEFYRCETASSTAKDWFLESEKSCQVPKSTASPRTTIPATSDSQKTIPRIYPSNAETTKKPWDKSLDFVIFFGPCLAVQALIPVFIWFGLTIGGLIRSCQTTQARSAERIEAVTKLQGGKYRRLVSIYSVFLNFAFWAWLAFVCTCALSDLSETHEYLFYCAIGMCFFCAIFVVVEGVTCPERIALQNIVSWEYIESLHATPPIIEMQVERFDWKTTQRAGYSTNPATGRLEYRNEIRRKVGRKIVREPFVFDSWRDASDRQNPFGRELTRIRLDAEVVLEGEMTEQSFRDQKESLIRKTDALNEYYETSRKDKTPNLHPFIILCCDPGLLPWWMKERFFWYASFLQLSWLYRALLNSQTKSGEYTLRKQVFADPSTRGTGDNQQDDGNAGIQVTQGPSFGDQNLVSDFPDPSQTSNEGASLIDSTNQPQNSDMTT